MIATNTKTLRLIWLPLCLGSAVRLLYPLGSTFPLNDGGMFFTMVQDLVANGYRLPAYTSYNHAGIPFAYPPAAFYLAAFLARIWPLLDVLRVLPALLSVLAIPMFYLLARDVLSDALGTNSGQRATWTATLAYALIPSSFQWQIMGGGLTRSLGYLAALTTLWCTWHLFDHPGSRRSTWLLGTSAALALAVASHPELGWFSVFSIALIFWARARGDRLRALRLLAGAGAIALAFTSPWWTVVIPRHGLAPYLAAFSTGEHGHAWALPFQATSFTGEPWLTIWGCLGLLGILACMCDRRFLLPAWLLAVYVLDPRKGMSLGAVPLAMMAGYATESLLRVCLPGALGKGALFGLAGYTAVAALALAVSPLPSWAVLPSSGQEAMAWVRQNTPVDSQFLVVSPSWLWARDQAGEWFPALAERASAATVQGREWVPGGKAYPAARELYDRLQQCQDAECLVTIAQHTHIYVTKTPVLIDAGVQRDLTAPLRMALSQSSNYRLVYENSGATVYERVDPHSQPNPTTR
jgi:hypothetical protein